VPKKSLGQFAIPLGVVFIVVMLVVPLPAALLDFLIVVNISGALVILLVAMFVKRPLDFAAFPALLLVATLFRLSLNVSATRLVLLDGYAGKVIDTFGHFVVGGSLIVGMVIFVILLIIQFVVITNGAGRVAEVGARFTLDAMPGKQMAIDADLNAGLINDEQARQRRADVAAEADFYGAMDGASKFVKGDAIAAIIITVINLVGGFAIGVAQMGMPFGEAVQTYSLLTIGDGLVSQIPALLLSVATGLVVTRSTADDDMGSDILKQLGRNATPLRIAGAGIIGLCIIPGLPKIPFLIVGSLLLLAASRVPAAKTADEEETEAVPVGPGPDSPEALTDEMRVDPLELELAADIIDLVDSASGGDLLDRVKALRRKVAMEIGVVIPPVRTRDSLDLPLHTYVIRVHGVEMARGEVPPGTVLAIADNLDNLPGRRTQEPVFGLSAVWLPSELTPQAEMSGATVVDRASVVTTHMAEVIRQNAADLLSREDTRALVEAVKRANPVVVEELTPAQLSLGEVQRVLQGLLSEKVAIRDLVRIFEALSLRARVSKDTDHLVEAARTVLGPAILSPYISDGTVSVISLDPTLEHRMLEALRPGENGAMLAIDPDLAQSALTQMGQYAEQVENANQSPILVCAPQIRSALSRLVATTLPRLPVLSYSELGGNASIRSAGVVSAQLTAVGA
jgi:flagellar biosynthesis protein FlhA